MSKFKHFFLAHQIREYIIEICYHHDNGFEVVPINKATLEDIRHIEIIPDKTLNEKDFTIDF